MLETAKEELIDLLTSRTIYGVLIGYMCATVRHSDMSPSLFLIHMGLIFLCMCIIVILGAQEDVIISNKNYLIIQSLDKMSANALDNAVSITPAIKEIEALEPDLCEVHAKYNNKYAEYKSKEN